MSLALDICLLFAAILFSCILGRAVYLHRISIGRVSFSGIYDIKYKGSISGGSTRFDFACSRVSFQFHFPRSPSPKWLTFDAEGVLYKSNTCDIFIGSIHATCWFFPRFNRQTAGPWVDTEIQDYRIRVMSSDEIPTYVQRLRANVVDAILTGEILRADDFATTVRFAGLSESGGEHSADVKETMPDGGVYNDKLDDRSAAVQDGLGSSNGGVTSISSHSKRHEAIPYLPQDQDELRVSALARGLHINNRQGRYYTFQTLDTQLRRNWVANRGTFVLIATECRWTRVPWPYEMVARSYWPVQLLSAIAHFPWDLMQCYSLPMSMANVYVHRLDVTFDNFRVRDAELVIQGLSRARQNMKKADIQWNDIFTDWLISSALGMLNGQ
ncbi:hypothetical protein BDW22DRAFT_1349952 [Trametopsis cervina]|nr:hypothetical protein BDW22DRAFT_1349952 [Trametopsis cervina]